MSKNFPKLTHNESDFPRLGNVDVYKYDNDFDYGRYDYTQMELIICSVPWDMGEVHIGNRTLSGVGNVVYFESKEKRDAWFDSIPDSECYRFETKFKELHSEHVIDVPIPYDMCARHNYLVVRYAMFANDDSPVRYEQEDGAREWFWFIREVEFVAPNTTRLHLLEDAFQTWIYDVDVTSMILERGHAPMFKTKVDAYLSNPLDNNEYLLTEDVNFGDATQVKNIDALALNYNDMMACIATTADPTGTWGSKSADSWKVPAKPSNTVNGVPSVFVFAINVGNLGDFLSNVDAGLPQFKQTIQGVFFASEDLLDLGGSFQFANTTCWPANAKRKVYDLTKLDKSLFGYPSDYAGIAKLYTSPYAHIEVTDENGVVDIIKVEDTTGTITVNAALSIAYPFVGIDAYLGGTGGNAGVTVKFKNVSEHSMTVDGAWYETLRSWKVPTFAVVLESSTEYDYSTHFDRKQRVVDYNTAYDNASASALTTKNTADASADANKANVDTIAGANKSNADASADTAKANSDLTSAANVAIAGNNASNVVANAGLNTAANTAIKDISNQNDTNVTSHAMDYNNLMATASNTITSLTALSTVAANEMQGSISSSSQMATSGISAMGSALSGDLGGFTSSIATGTIGAQATLASTHVASGQTVVQSGATQAQTTVSATLANTKSNDDLTSNKDARTDICKEQNDAITGIAANNAATMNDNAAEMYGQPNGAVPQASTNTQTTEKDNAARTQTAATTAASNTQTVEKANNSTRYNTAISNAGRSKTQAQSAITNDTAQAALKAPYVFGQFADGDSATTKPIALFSHIVTQSKGAISSAGDEMLRYGYMLDKQWKFDGNWNVGKYFTYWKLRDFWVSNLNVPDMYMDRLRFFLYGGVTIWRKPEDIGKRTIYENFEG